MTRRLLIISALSLCLFVGSAVAQKRGGNSRTVYRGPVATVTVKGGPTLSPEMQRRHSAFDQVWSAIKANYFDSTFSNVDWDKVRAEYEPQVRLTKTDHELHGLLSRMIAKLRASHLAIIPPEVYEAIETAKQQAKAREKKLVGAVSEEGDDEEEASALDSILHNESTRYGLGIDLTLIDDRFVITRIDKDSAAENAGLTTGQSVETVNGVSLHEMLARVMLYYPGVQAASVRSQMPAEIVESIINGDRDTHVELGVSDVVGSTKQFRILRERLRRESPVIITPNFPERTLSFESRTLGPSTGYIRFNLFAAAVVPKFCAAIAEHSGRESLILDLRGNSGGLVGALPVLVGMLSPETVDIGTMKYRTTEQALSGKSRPKHFKGRLVVLVDSRTASAAEIFAIALRENGRAVVIGETTAGAALPSITIRLDTGASLQYPIASYTSSRGRAVEGAGVVPNPILKWNRKSLLEGKDIQLEEALRVSGDGAIYAGLIAKPAPLPSKSLLTAAAPPPPPPAKPIPKAVDPAAGPLRQEAARAVQPGHDTSSKRIVEQFLTAVGGRDELKKISNYKLQGNVSFTTAGIGYEYQITSFREFPDKYAETLVSVVMGETRQIKNGKKLLVQSELGVEVELPFELEMNEVDRLTALFMLAQAETLIPSLSSTGEYLRDDRKTAVLEGRLADGTIAAFAFDVETKMLVNFTAGRTSISFSDYQKVGSVQLPFEINRGREILSVSSYAVNSKIEPADFERKKFCFDTP